ncbi:Protein of unknown function [Lactobacillus delbrueckii subsp. lactis]|nr:Protein of unknown function [Lactobacillus delbrueckii subsp. lactis]
MTKREL